MVLLSRSLFAISITVLLGVLMLGDRLPEWCAPVSTALAVAGALVFLVSFIDVHRRQNYTDH
ncbi:hypothetical protein SAMN06295885_0702 [Rathayibacter oskolensis]|uniref:Uncharacterized protein n=1 Tax=Rathayibacter oskolensis TaxID=1891671 RepID=A0A1X7N5Y1_9MICO|nr:hypothetical protein [Rathayibacter oskolensis]SMH32172.1 hypothetical protein SAMN06295885_0702 [Rathayibacter oskolensis]